MTKAPQQPLTPDEIERLRACVEMPHGALIPFGLDRIIATIDALQSTLDRLVEPGAAHAALTEWWGESRADDDIKYDNGATEGMQAEIKAASAKKEGT